MNNQLKRTLSVVLAVIMTVMTLAMTMPVTAADDHTGHATRVIDEIAAGECSDGFTAGVYCNTCGIYISGHETIPALHYPSGVWVTEPDPVTDCNQGYIRKQYCTKCNKVIKEEEVEAHDWEIVKTEDPTDDCTKEGKKYKKCKVCGIEVTETIPGEEAHTWGSWRTEYEVTCTIDGKDVRYCRKCACYEENIVTAKGHKIKVYDKGLEPTCEKEGREASTMCERCGEVIYKGTVIPMLDHVDADGDGYCDNCDNYEDCDCLCHSKNAVISFLYRIVIFFMQIFGQSLECKCGAPHNII